jgi:hypothetical protein
VLHIVRETATGYNRCLYILFLGLRQSSRFVRVAAGTANTETLINEFFLNVRAFGGSYGAVSLESLAFVFQAKQGSDSAAAKGMAEHAVNVSQYK